MQIRGATVGAVAALCAAIHFSGPVMAAGQAAKGAGKAVPARLEPARRRGRPIERLAKELKITPAQRAKIKPILAEETRQIRAIRAATRTKLIAVLTPEQRKKMAAIQARERQQQKARTAAKKAAQKTRP